ncbi:MAG TPA: ATP-binding cassette domain-containing protein [Streptosporangiaceae bacterium]|jgi:ATPase subunit of ABC transporter with duplicated ATPase domains
MSAPIVVSDLSFAWPDGRAVFDGLDLVIGTGRTGLVGANGSGKSTLLRLVAGELTATRGSATAAGSLGYLPQDITLHRGRRVDHVLGIASIRAALSAIESGDTAVEHFTTVGDDWDAEARAVATLERLGLGDITLDRRVDELSGGESVLLALAALLIRRPGVLLLDEPTNNLDLDARRLLYQAVDAWPGVLVVVSHDRDLLERVDTTVELYRGEARSFGGNIRDYEATLAAEQETAERLVRTAGSDLRRQRRELAEARIKLDRRLRYGRKMWDSKREPKIIMAERKRQAQVSAGKHRNLHLDRVEQAQERLATVEEAVRDDDEVRIDLPATEVPPRRAVLDVDAVRLRCGLTVTLHIQGPERIALVGPNGAGKTTLLRTITGDLPAMASEAGLEGEGTARLAPAATGSPVRLAVPARLLPQRLDVLDPALSVAGNVAQFAPQASANEIRANLARVLFPGERASQSVATLSGGELFRATLAALLLAEPAPQLLMLDEPTNNLDLPSVRQLTEALRCYRGALLVASHDVPFLRDLGLTRWLRLDPGQDSPAGLRDPGSQEPGLQEPGLQEPGSREPGLQEIEPM